MLLYKFLSFNDLYFFAVKTPYKIYSLDFLVSELFSKLNIEILDSVISNEILSSCRFDYVASLCCWVCIYIMVI